jgi:hypothetical protein
MSVSANAAAFAMDALKPPARKGAKHAVDENVGTALLSEPEKNTDAILPPSESITAVSARLAMLDNAHMHYQQATLEQAVEAYLRSGG